MILLNFGPKQNKMFFDQFQAMTNKKIDEQITIPLEFENSEEFITTLMKAFSKLNVTEEFLKANELVLFPPASSHAALCLLAELFRITGRMPLIIRTRQNLYSFISRSDIIEVIDLEKIAHTTY